MKDQRPETALPPGHTCEPPGDTAEDIDAVAYDLRCAGCVALRIAIDGPMVPVGPPLLHRRERALPDARIVELEARIKVQAETIELGRGCVDSLRAERDRLRAVAEAVGRLIAANDEERGLDRPRPDIAWRDVKQAYAAIDASASRESPEACPCCEAAADLNVACVAYEKALENMCRDFTCAECGRKVTDHVVVSRCGCGEAWTGPSPAAYVEHEREEAARPCAGNVQTTDKLADSPHHDVREDGCQACDDEVAAGIDAVPSSSEPSFVGSGGHSDSPEAKLLHAVIYYAEAWEDGDDAWHAISHIRNLIAEYDARSPQARKEG